MKFISKTKWLADFESLAFHLICIRRSTNNYLHGDHWRKVITDTRDEIASVQFSPETLERLCDYGWKRAWLKASRYYPDLSEKRQLTSAQMIGHDFFPEMMYPKHPANDELLKQRKL